MSNEETDLKLVKKLAEITAKNKEWLNRISHLSEKSDSGVWSMPQNQKALNQMRADADECAQEEKKDKSGNEHE
jgi:DNA-binding PadR family transcriptional regulator